MKGREKEGGGGDGGWEEEGQLETMRLRKSGLFVEIRKCKCINECSSEEKMTRTTGIITVCIQKQLYGLDTEHSQRRTRDQIPGKPVVSTSLLGFLHSWPLRTSLLDPPNSRGKLWRR